MADDIDQSSAADKLQKKIPPDYSRKHTMASRWQLKARWIWLSACIIFSASNISNLQMIPVLKQTVAVQAFVSEDFYHTNAADDTSMLHCIMSMLAINHPRSHGDKHPTIPFADIGQRRLLLPQDGLAPPPMMPEQVSVNIPSTKPIYEMVSTGSDDDQSIIVAVNICDSSVATGNDLPTTTNFIKCAGPGAAANKVGASLCRYAINGRQ